MSNRFENKVIFGHPAPAAGMGRAAAERLGAEGATVVLAARDKDRGEEIAGRIRNNGGKALFVSTDVTVEEEVAAVVEAATSTFGRLDGAFNNAGGGVTLRVGAFDGELVLGLDRCPQPHQRVLQHEGRGSGHPRFRWRVDRQQRLSRWSCRTRVDARVHGSQARCDRADPLDRAALFTPRSEGCNALVTGVINTPLTDELRESDPAFSDALLQKIPIERLGQEDEVGAFAAFLLSDEAAYLTGGALAIDGGITAGMLA